MYFGPNPHTQEAKHCACPALWRECPWMAQDCDTKQVDVHSLRIF